MQHSQLRFQSFNPSLTVLTDLQILGCELHQNAFGGWAQPGSAGKAIALPQAPNCYKGKGREGRGRKRFGIVGGGMGGKGKM